MGIIDGIGLHGGNEGRSWDPDTETYWYGDAPYDGGFFVREHVPDIRVVRIDPLAPADGLYPSAEVVPVNGFTQEMQKEHVGQTGERRGGRRAPENETQLSGGFVPTFFLNGD